MTIVTILLFTLFVALGRWQWHRAGEKTRLWAEFSAGASAAPGGVGAIALLGHDGTRSVARYARVRVQGRWDTAHQFLLDNQSHDGQPGYHVLTPLRREDGTTLLVDRGWVPFSGYRERLPDVGFVRNEAVEIRGRVDRFAVAGLAGGRAAPATAGPWPRVTSFPEPGEIEAALGAGARVAPQLLLLDADQPDGYLRDWKPPGRSPDTNWSYAFQWWSFAALLLVLYFALNTRRTVPA
jgi:surfeit locus 1 family protein